MSSLFLSFFPKGKIRLHLPLQILFACIIFPASMYAQTYQAFLNAGNKALAEKNYYTASYYFKNALVLDSSKLSLAYNYAETSRLVNDYIEAEYWYDYVQKKAGEDEFEEAVFWLAMMKKSKNKYKEAASLFEKYYTSHSKENTWFAKRAQKEIAACAKAEYILKHPVPFSIQNAGLAINAEGADFDAFQVNDSILYFSSLRHLDSLKNKDKTTGNTKLYTSHKKNNKWTPAIPLNFMHADTSKHIANGSFAPDGASYYFTSCLPDYHPGESGCALYRSHLKNGAWTLPERLNDSINFPGSSSTQPALAHDLHGQTLLYFSSDRPGGFGKMDIWYAYIKPDESILAPQNAGPSINTTEDEVTPYVEPNTHLLYFSSDGHDGLGGFDIFKAKGRGHTWSKPENIGYPLNDGFNDLYFTTYKEGGFLTSNRPGSTTSGYSTCCNDIYIFTPEKIIPPVDSLVTAKIVADSLSKNKELLNAGNNTQTAINTAKSAKEKLKNSPVVTVYFDNDYPTPRSTNDTCNNPYTNYYNEYLKEELAYNKAFLLGVSGPKQKLANEQVTRFFEEKVKKGYTDLKELTLVVQEALQAGLSVKLHIGGYCSPLTTSSYNIHLARRRISSIQNYFMQYDNGVLRKYIVHTLGKPQLSFTEDVVGESKAAKGVSDNYYDTKNSIFNPGAAVERKAVIEVLGVE